MKAQKQGEEYIEKGGPRSIGKSISLISGISCVAAWIFVSYVALSKHPVAAINAAASTRHNIFTIAQALAFPVPVLSSVVAVLCSAGETNNSNIQNHRRLSLGLVVTSFWTAAAIFFGPTFSVGYDLFSNPMRYTCATIFCLQGLLAATSWKQKYGGAISNITPGCIRSFYDVLSPQDTNDNSSTASLYAFGSLGLLILALLPQLVGFPTATIPTPLGKRFSRAASGFTFLGSVVTFSLMKGHQQGKQNNIVLRVGLGIGSILHIGLVIAKLIGLDGGGLLLPGRGLWQDYPSLVKASTSATSLMMITYAVLGLACFENQGQSRGGGYSDDDNLLEALEVIHNP